MVYTTFQFSKYLTFHDQIQSNSMTKLPKNDYYTVFQDYVRAAFGTGKDLKIWHDATSSYIRTYRERVESGTHANLIYFLQIIAHHYQLYFYFL